MAEKNNKRAVATVTFYTYGANDQELIKEALKIAQELRGKYDNCAEVETLHEQQFGKIGNREIPLEPIPGADQLADLAVIAEEIKGY